MEAMRVLIESKPGFQNIMVQLWKYVLNDEHAFDAGKPIIHCADYAIPLAQNSQIIEWLTEAIDPNSDTCIAMHYIDVSPSSY